MRNGQLTIGRVRGIELTLIQYSIIIVAGAIALPKEGSLVYFVGVASLGLPRSIVTIQVTIQVSDRASGVETRFLADSQIKFESIL